MSNLLYPTVVTTKQKQNRTETKPRVLGWWVGSQSINSYVESSLVWGLVAGSECICCIVNYESDE